MCGNPSYPPTPHSTSAPVPFSICCKQGSEYLQYGLQTAAATHWLYDWAALIYIIGVWGGGGSDDGSSRGGGGSNREAGSTPEPGSLQQDPELGGR